MIKKSEEILKNKTKFWGNIKQNFTQITPLKRRLLEKKDRKDSRKLKKLNGRKIFRRT